MRAYSLDLRERVVAAYQDTPVIAQVARTFRLSESAVRSYVRAHAAGQPLAPVRHKGRVRILGEASHTALRAQVEQYPDATLAEHVEYYFEQHGVRVSIKTMDRMFERLSITRKKDRPRH
ncbi:IS630 transposase-related protein [Deinococcus peraridilitoris]|uniref:IS630 transposase-related protein n=1 Tax=Deinococcus peraridilitoris TaxID=432329 RepID=UPI000A00306E|nr:IS630 transposase-related protein [Deinococcus peraridilitoris]